MPPCRIKTILSGAHPLPGYEEDHLNRFHSLLRRRNRLVVALALDATPLSLEPSSGQVILLFHRPHC